MLLLVLTLIRKGPRRRLRANPAVTNQSRVRPLASKHPLVATFQNQEQPRLSNAVLVSTPPARAHSHAQSLIPAFSLTSKGHRHRKSAPLVLINLHLVQKAASWLQKAHSSLLQKQLNKRSVVPERTKTKQVNRNVLMVVPGTTLPNPDQPNALHAKLESFRTPQLTPGVFQQNLEHSSTLTMRLRW